MGIQDAWAILAEQGLLFRPALAHKPGWEYTITKLGEAWYGLYTTREEALRAALRHLLDLIPKGSAIVEPAAPASAVTEPRSAGPESQLRPLLEQLRYLYIEAARRGIVGSSELEPRIAHLIEQIKRIKAGDI